MSGREYSGDCEGFLIAVQVRIVLSAETRSGLHAHGRVKPTSRRRRAAAPRRAGVGQRSRLDRLTSPRARYNLFRRTPSISRFMRALCEPTARPREWRGPRDRPGGEDGASRRRAPLVPRPRRQPLLGLGRRTVDRLAEVGGETGARKLYMLDALCLQRFLPPFLSSLLCRQHDFGAAVVADGELDLAVLLLAAVVNRSRLAGLPGRERHFSLLVR